jgi:dipeptidase
MPSKPKSAILSTPSLLRRRFAAVGLRYDAKYREHTFHVTMYDVLHVHVVYTCGGHHWLAEKYIVI